MHGFRWRLRAGWFLGEEPGLQDSIGSLEREGGRDGKLALGWGTLPGEVCTLWCETSSPQAEKGHQLKCVTELGLARDPQTSPGTLRPPPSQTRRHVP